MGIFDRSESSIVREFPVKSAASQVIPHGGLMEITSTEGGPGGAVLYNVRRPASDGISPQLLLVNTGPPIPASGYGKGSQDWPLYAKYNTGATPSLGKMWGSATDSFELTEFKFGFTIAGSTSDGLVRVKAGCRSRFKAKADGAITAGSSGTVSVWLGGSDSGINVTAHLNWMDGGEDISSGVELLIEWFPDESKWVIVGADCEA